MFLKCNYSHIIISLDSIHVTLFSEYVLQRLGFSFSPSQSQSKQGSRKENGEMSVKYEASVFADSQGQDENDDSGPNLASKDNTDKNVKRRIRRTKQPVSSDSDCDSDLDTEDLSRDDLVKLVAEKEKLLKIKDYEFQKMKKNVVI